MIGAKGAMGLCTIFVWASCVRCHSLRRIWPALICPGMTALFVLIASLHEYEQTLSL
jgi:hypothetical protein